MPATGICCYFILKFNVPAFMLSTTIYDSFFTAICECESICYGLLSYYYDESIGSLFYTIGMSWYIPLTILSASIGALLLFLFVGL